MRKRGVASDKKHIYASPEALGQSFSFDMLMCQYGADDFKKTIKNSLANAERSGSSNTWVFSNHDVSQLSVSNASAYWFWLTNGARSSDMRHDTVFLAENGMQANTVLSNSAANISSPAARTPCAISPRV